MAIKFQKARREKIYVKCLLAGPSGSGKSYTALRMATGMAQEDGSRVAVIDTENGRIRYYANEFDFDDLQLQDFRPESYIEAIEAAVDGGYHVIVIDGITPEWDWCNATHDAMSGNSFTNWGKITPRHEKFMNKMLECPAHIIATVRGKDSYVLEENGGKQQPKKVGMGYQARGIKDQRFDTVFPHNTFGGRHQVRNLLIDRILIEKQLAFVRPIDRIECVSANLINFACTIRLIVFRNTKTSRMAEINPRFQTLIG